MNYCGSRPFATVLPTTMLVVFIFCLFSKTVIIFFRQRLKRLASNFSTWSGPWPVFIQVDLQLFHDPFAHIPIAQLRKFKIMLTSNELYIQNIFGDSSVFNSSDMSQPAQLCLQIIVNLIDSPHLERTIVFGVLHVQDIPISFLSERIWNKFNPRS